MIDRFKSASFYFCRGEKYFAPTKDGIQRAKPFEIRFFFVACLAMLLPGKAFANLPTNNDPPPQHFRIDQIVEDDWGKLISVYDQPTYQRFTFESDSQVTILHVGLVWDNREGSYRPNIKQVIHLMKKTRDKKSVLAAPTYNAFQP